MRKEGGGRTGGRGREEPPLPLPDPSPDGCSLCLVWILVVYPPSIGIQPGPAHELMGLLLGLLLVEIGSLTEDIKKEIYLNAMIT